MEQGHAYYCFCTPEQLEAERKEAIARGLPAKYSGRCAVIDPETARRRVESGDAAAIRFRTPGSREIVFHDLVRGDVRFHSDVIGDQILVRSDGNPAYNFAVVVDDALMGITHVVRGEDHLSNTPRQLLIYEALRLSPPAFAHVSLVLGPDHSPLSKRHGATSVEEFREKGYLPEALVNYLALLSWSPGDNLELLPITEIARRFAIEDVGHSASVFDEEKLAWANRHYLKAADPARLAALSVPYLERAGYVRQAALTPEGRAYLTAIMPLVSSSVDRLSQVPERLRTLFEFNPDAALAVPKVQHEVSRSPARDVVMALAADLEKAPRLVDRDSFRAAAARVRAKTGRKGKDLFHPIRLALTAAADGPELDLLVPAIDRGASRASADGVVAVLGCRERAAAFAARL
jgi:glutamyl-tRNA synthetase/nondiscriminating glutamyl-tRNA synthetase